MKKAAEEKSAGTASSPSSSRFGGRIETPPCSQATSAPAAESMRSVWSRLRRRLDDPGFALGEQAGEEQARLDLGAGDRQLVLDRLAAAQPRPAAAAGDPRGSSAGRPSRAAARRCGRPGGGGSSRRRRASSAPRGCPASQPGSRRSRVPALPTSIWAGLAPRRPTPSIRIVSATLSALAPSTTAPSAATAARVERVSAESR